MGTSTSANRKYVGTVFGGQSSSHVTMNVPAIYCCDCCALKMVFDTLTRFLKIQLVILNAIDRALFAPFIFKIFSL